MLLSEIKNVAEGALNFVDEFVHMELERLFGRRWQSSVRYASPPLSCLKGFCSSRASSVTDNKTKSPEPTSLVYVLYQAGYQHILSSGGADETSRSRRVK